MLDFFALISLIFCFAITLSIPASEGKKVYIFVNIASICIFLIVALCFKITQTYTNIHIISTGIANIMTFSITSSYYYYIEEHLSYMCADDSITKLDHEKKLLAFKIIIVILTVAIIFLSSFLCFSYQKLLKSQSLVAKYKDKIETYKSEIKTNKEQISSLEIENQQYFDAVVNQESDIIDKDAYIEDLERDIDLYERVTGNKKGFVFVTRTGKRFHLVTCYHLADSCYFRMYTEAIRQGYTPCSNCLPNGY